jgi:hypothetical protein
MRRFASELKRLHGFAVRRTPTRGLLEYSIDAGHPAQAD